MADIDIDPFGENDRTELRLEEPTDENIPLDPVGGCSFVTQAQVHSASGEQETSFGREIHGSVLHKEYLVGEIHELMVVKRTKE